MAKWQSIAAEYQTSIMAQFYAFDTEANKTICVPVDTQNIKKALIKVKTDQRELLQEYTGNGVQGDGMTASSTTASGWRTRCLPARRWQRRKYWPPEKSRFGKTTWLFRWITASRPHHLPQKHHQDEEESAPAVCPNSLWAKENAVSAASESEKLF